MQHCKLPSHVTWRGACSRPFPVPRRSLHSVFTLPPWNTSEQEPVFRRCRDAIPASLRHMRCSSRHSTRSSNKSWRDQSVVPAAADELEFIISDVLKEHRASIQRPSDLLGLLDGAGHGLSCTVQRSWSTRGVQLALHGTWASGPQARKMAMLAVYQECLVSRAAALLRLLRYVASRQPGVVDSSAVQQVEAAAAATNPVNPAVEGLLVPQLTQLAAACYPWQVLSRVLEQAVAEAKQQLLKKPPYSYSAAARQAAQQQLLFVETSLARGAAFARLRALLQQQGKLMHWQQQAAAAAAGLNSGHQQLLTAEHAYYEAWKQQQLQTAAGASPRRSTLVATFHRRSETFPYFLQPSPGSATAATTIATAAAAAASQSMTAAAVADEVQQLCTVLQQLSGFAQQLKQGLDGGSASTLGVLGEVQRCCRTALLHVCVTWSEACPDIQQQEQPEVVAARVAVSSIEHDQLLRRIGLEVRGAAEVPVLRRLAVSKGKQFLQSFSPTLGNPFAATAEWDYFRECPGVFTRFAEDPPTQQATLTIKALSTLQQPPAAPHHHQQQQQQQQQQQAGSESAPATVPPAAPTQQVTLSASELQQLLQQLTLVLSGNSSSSSSNTAAAALDVTAPGDRQIRLCPTSSTTTIGSSARQTTAAATVQLQLLVDGIAAADLTAAHVVSLLTLVEDLVGQLPGQYSVAPAAVQVVPAPPLQRAFAAAASWLGSSSRTFAAVALLALPLIAIQRPCRMLQLLPTTAYSTSRTSTDTHSTTNTASTAAPAAAVSERVQPRNNKLSSQALQQVCSGVQQQLHGKIWLPDSLLPADMKQQLQQLVGSASKAGEQVNSSSSSSRDGDQLSQSAADLMVFQVTLDSWGTVLGFKPCSDAAAAVWLEVPLAAALRGPELAAAQTRRSAVITSADAASPHPAKKPPGPCRSRLAHKPLQQQPLPGDGAVVLKLLLLPQPVMPVCYHTEPPSSQACGRQQQTLGDEQDAVSATAAGEFVQQQQQQDGMLQQQSQAQQLYKTVGSGKAAMKFWLMAPIVTPWRDEDSLAAWVRGGAVLPPPKQQQQQQQQQQHSRLVLGAQGPAPGSSSSQMAHPAGVTATLNGNQVDSWEALLNQVLAASLEQGSTNQPK